jgi:hypothetical protein
VPLIFKFVRGAHHERTALKKSGRARRNRLLKGNTETWLMGVTG